MSMDFSVWTTKPIPPNYKPLIDAGFVYHPAKDNEHEWYELDGEKQVGDKQGAYNVHVNVTDIITANPEDLDLEFTPLKKTKELGLQIRYHYEFHFMGVSSMPESVFEDALGKDMLGGYCMAIAKEFGGVVDECGEGRLYTVSGEEIDYSAEWNSDNKPPFIGGGANSIEKRRRKILGLSVIPLVLALGIGIGLMVLMDGNELSMMISSFLFVGALIGWTIFAVVLFKKIGRENNNFDPYYFDSMALDDIDYDHFKTNLVFKDDKSDKFWSINYFPDYYYNFVHYGKNGTIGRIEFPNHDSDSDGQVEFWSQQKIKEKMRKGYVPMPPNPVDKFEQHKKKIKPTLDSLRAMNEDNSGGGIFQIAAFKSLCDKYCDLLREAEGNEAKIKAAIKALVLAINGIPEWDKVNGEVIEIETDEREMLFEFMCEGWKLAGLDTDEDLTEGWRDW